MSAPRAPYLFRLALTSLCATAAGVVASHGQAISFNSVGALSGGMTATDVAGAPGVSVARWNNMFSTASGGAAITGSLGAGSILDSAGATLSLMTLNWTGTGQANAAGSGTNSQKMFESEWDLFDTGGNTAVVDMTFTLTNIPYAVYDVYYYVQDASNADNRGGEVSANGTTESIRMYSFPTDIPGGPTNYVEANSAIPWHATNTNQGTYLRLENITGSTLTLTVSSENPTTPRIRMSGFQVVAVPEPATGLAVLGGAAMLFSLRRRR